jgi:hypothetical protein
MTTLTEADRRKILESLTSDDLATFQEAFTVFDKNHDGTITTKVWGRRPMLFFRKYFRPNKLGRERYYLCKYTPWRCGAVDIAAASETADPGLNPARV